MTKISQLLTGKIKGKQVINSASVNKQKLAVATALQILEHLPFRTIPRDWEKYNFLRGVLLADEVGGGKTFEALSIISQAFLSSSNTRRRRFRVLIIAAPAIRSKWEWREETEKEKWCDLKRFVEQTNLSRSRKDALENFFRTAQSENILTSKYHWKYVQNIRQGIWVASFGALPATRGSKTQAEFKRDRYVQFPTGYFDYIIADEAHIVKSGYIDSDENISTSLNNSAIRKIYAVQNENAKAKLLLLTATPFQNNLDEFIHMLSLIESPSDSKTFSVIKIIKEGLKELYREIKLLKNENGITKEKISNLINSFDNEVGNLIGKKSEETKRPKEICTNGRRNGLDDFLRDVMIRNNKEPLDIVSTECNLNDAEKLQYLLLRDIVSNKHDEEREMFSVKLSQLVSSEDAFASFHKPQQKKKYNSIKKLFQNKHLVFENKFNELLQVIDSKKFPTDKRVLVVFCRFIPTIEVLEKRLSKVYSEKNVLRMDGRTTNTKRRKELLQQIEKRNQETDKRIIFLVSQVGNEGLDFDNFSDTVIHFDGHYNPAVVDQRNGRVYRRGNLKREITVKHIYLKDTYDQTIKFIELEKRKIKNFFLGDSSLNEIINRISREEIPKGKSIYKGLETEWKKIRFTLEPKEKYLLPKVKKLL